MTDLLGLILVVGTWMLTVYGFTLVGKPFPVVIPATHAWVGVCRALLWTGLIAVALDWV